MLYTCTCNGQVSTVDTCSKCTCPSGTLTCFPENTNGSSTVLGISLAFFLILFFITVAIWAVMIWFSVHVMRKCKGRPGWLNPTVITLLVLWLLMGWIPGLGFLFFVSLLIILIIFNNKCNQKIKM